MGKNMKKVLSYTLGIILAMGLGLSYAYAVGANDSNAFVTNTEWEAKVTQIETSIDNVKKTIGDTNMDFVMNGPRLQTSVVDGTWNCGSVQSTDNAGFGSMPWHNATLTDLGNLYSRFNDLTIQDLWNGRQSINKFYWSTGDATTTTYKLGVRYALATTTPDWYIIVNMYNNASWTFHYAKLGTYPIESSVSARSLTVKLPVNEWNWHYARNDTATIGAVSRTYNYIYSGNVGFNSYIVYTASSGYNGYGSTTGYITRTVDSDYYTQTFEFPSGYYSICSIGASTGHFPFWPLDMSSRKFGSEGDNLIVSPTTSGVVAKVYSPVKGCYCLKSYLNGEIPILNE